MFGWLRRHRLGTLRRSPDLVSVARAEAADSGCEYVGTEHLLLALSRRTDSPGWRAIAACGIGPKQLREAVRRTQLPGMGEVKPDEMPLTPTTRQVIARAADYAQQLGHASLVPEHVLIAVLGDPEGVAYATLTGLGVRPRELGLAVIREAGWPMPTSFDDSPLA